MIDKNLTSENDKGKAYSVNIKTLWMPMKLVQTYLFFVFILFAFGPWPWPISEKIYVNFYILFAQVMLCLGYFISVKHKKIYVITNRKVRSSSKSINIQKLIKRLLLISIILVIPNYMTRVGISTLNPIEFFNSFLNGLLNPGAQYHYKLSIQGQSSGSMFLLLITAITSPFRWLLTPVGILYWSEIRKKYKFGIVVLIIIDIMSWVSIGTNKGIFDNIFIIIFSLVAKFAIQNKNINSIFSISKSKLKLILVSFSGIAVSIYYLTTAVKSRMGTINYYYQAANINVDYDSPLMVLMPNFIKDVIIVISRYITQGYYGLSLAMKEDFTTTFGFGNSWFLLSLFEKVTGNSALELNTYPFKIMKYGWDPYINWHSIYTWLASDFSFIGTLFLMVIIGFCFGEIWKSVLYQKNIYAIGLFVLYMIMFVYFPANNQIFAFIHTFAAFWGLFVLWIFNTKIKLR